MKSVITCFLLLALVFCILETVDAQWGYNPYRHHRRMMRRRMMYGYGGYGHGMYGMYGNPYMMYGK